MEIQKGVLVALVLAYMSFLVAAASFSNLLAAWLRFRKNEIENDCHKGKVCHKKMHLTGFRNASWKTEHNEATKWLTRVRQRCVIDRVKCFNIWQQMKKGDNEEIETMRKIYDSDMCVRIWGCGVQVTWLHILTDCCRATDMKKEMHQEIVVACKDWIRRSTGLEEEVPIFPCYHTEESGSEESIMEKAPWQGFRIANAHAGCVPKQWMKV